MQLIRHVVRPVAPAFELPAKKSDVAKPDLNATFITQAPIECLNCFSINQPHLRFCSVCGTPLDPDYAPSSRNVGARPGAEGAPSSDASEIPAPPIPLVNRSERPPPTESRATVRVCLQCRSIADSAANFCRFCGARLPETLREEMSTDLGPELPRDEPSPHSEITTTEPRAVSEAARSVMADAFRAQAAPPADQGAADRAHSPTEAGAAQIVGRLVLIGRDGAETAAFPMTQNTDLGRSEGDIRIEDDVYLCARHARLTMRGALMFIVDLGSVNGVYLRLNPLSAGESVREGVGMPLVDQDLFLIGQQVIKFEAVKEAEEGFGSASQRGTLIFGTPLGPRYGRLSVMTVEGIARDVYYLRKPETVLGRETGDILFTDDPFLSRRHVLIRVHRERRSFELVDLRSSNGSFLRIHGEAALNDGAQFRIGQQLFRFDRSKAPSASMKVRE